MKKLLAIILCCLLVVSLAACAPANQVSVNVDSGNVLHNNMLGTSAMINIGDGLWYDSTTRIVYWWNGIFTGYRSDTAPSPYYAPNGLPYRYNPETNTFEEVDSGNVLHNNMLGTSAMINIGDGLWYDSTTRIVYWWNGIFTAYRSDTTPSPYYAPNGLPYRYNPETNTFEEIVR